MIKFNPHPKAPATEVFLGSRFIPADLASRQSHFDGAWRMRMRSRGLPAPDWSTRSHRQALSLDDYIYHASGAMPLLSGGFKA